jgi:hypothetical protein
MRQHGMVSLSQTGSGNLPCRRQRSIVHGFTLRTWARRRFRMRVTDERSGSGPSGVGPEITRACTASCGGAPFRSAAQLIGMVDAELEGRDAASDEVRCGLCAGRTPTAALRGLFISATQHRWRVRRSISPHQRCCIGPTASKGRHALCQLRMYPFSNCCQQIHILCISKKLVFSNSFPALKYSKRVQCLYLSSITPSAGCTRFATCDDHSSSSFRFSSIG